MAAVWPATLPSGLLLEKRFAIGGPGNVIRNESITGRVKTVRVSTKTQRVIEGTMAMTSAQITTFETFFRTTLKDGRDPFQGLTHPISGANTVWLFLQDPTQQNYSKSGSIYEVPMMLLALPDTPTP